MATGTLLAANDAVQITAGASVLGTIVPGTQPGAVSFQQWDTAESVWLPCPVLLNGFNVTSVFVTPSATLTFSGPTIGTLFRVVTTTGFNGSAATVTLLAAAASGGGGGGGAVTIADGANVTFGSEADAAAAGDTTTTTYIGLFKRLLQRVTSLIALWAVDAAAWTAGVSTFILQGILYNDSAAALTSGQQGGLRGTANRALHVNLRDPNGVERGTSANPLATYLALGLKFASDTTGDNVGAMPQAAATGGASIKRIISANSTNGTLVKASAGNLYSVRVANLDTTAAAYVKLYNEISNPPAVGTDTVFDTFPCPAAVSATQPSIAIFSGPAVGVFLSAGIGVGITQLLADSDTTAVGANKVLVTLYYN